jgi:hypothetical protein
METQYTPGPWTLQELETHRNGYGDWKTFAVRSPANVCLAIVGAVDHYESERIPANALLMASVTELLDVCEAIAALNEGQGQLNLCEVAGWARQVLAKAMGAKS